MAGFALITHGRFTVITEVMENTLLSFGSTVSIMYYLDISAMVTLIKSAMAKPGTRILRWFMIRSGGAGRWRSIGTEVRSLPFLWILENSNNW